MADTATSSNKWTKRDVLTFVAFNLIIIVITMALKMAEDMVLSPQHTFFVGSWLFPLAATPFYIVMADRIGKRGVLLGTTVIFGILYTFMGGIYCLPIGIVGGIVGELLMGGENSYHNPIRLMVGYFVYWVTFGCYGIFPYLFFRESYTLFWGDTFISERLGQFPKASFPIFITDAGISMVCNAVHS